MTTQAGGLLVHGILGKTFGQAFEDMPDSDDEDDPNDDDAAKWRKFTHRKARTARDFTNDPAMVQHLASVVVVTESMDKLSSRLQSADSHRGGILEIIDPKGPVSDAQRALFCFVNAGQQDEDWQGRIPMRYLLDHFHDIGAEALA